MTIADYRAQSGIIAPSQCEGRTSQNQKLFDAEMRLSILQTKLGDALRERNGRRRRRQPTRMIDTIIEIMRGDIARMTRHLDALRGA